MRALVFDVGNTRVKWGVAEDGRLARTGSITHETLKESGFATLTTRLPRDVDRVLASNVAGATFGTRLSGVIGIHCGQDLHFVHSEASAYGVTNSYKRPRQLGVDRWVAMIGARAAWRSPLLVVDAGTAVTIDALDGDGRHLGGQIIPGIVMMANTLRAETSDIAKTSRARKKSGRAAAMFANSTDGAIVGGAVNAVCGAIDRARRALAKEHRRPQLVLTGGDGSRILEELEGTPHHRPNLVLEGLAFMLQSET